MNKETVVDNKTLVSAAELADGLGASVEEIEAFVQMGVLTLSEEGLFELWSSVRAIVAFWEAAAAMGGPVQGTA